MPNIYLLVINVCLSYYSILGVTKNCPDEVIKKYYKRQAVLVHPDKNNQPGAEEAFKILVHAFDLIGEPVIDVKSASKTRIEVVDLSNENLLITPLPGKKKSV